MSVLLLVMLSLFAGTFLYSGSSAHAHHVASEPKRSVIIKNYDKLFKAARTHGIHSPKNYRRTKPLNWNLVYKDGIRIWRQLYPAHYKEFRKKEVYQNISRVRPKWPENKRIVYAWWVAHKKPEANFNCLATIVDRYENGSWHVNMVYGRKIISPQAMLWTNLAGGIPQALPPRKMASAGKDWATNPITQFLWMEGYAYSRYGSPCGALAYRQSHEYY